MDKTQTYKLGLVIAVTLLNGASAFAESRREIVGVGSCLNFRAKPSYYARTIECVKPDTTVKYIQSSQRGYSLVEINGQRGYVYNRYLGVTSAAKTSAPLAVTPGPLKAATATPAPAASTPPPLIQATAARADVDLQPEKPLIPPAATAKVGLPSQEKSEGHVALWGTDGEKAQWTKAAVAAIREHWSKFMKAKDLNEFCPRFKEASRFEQETCILNIVAAVVKFESNFKPRDVSSEGAPLYYNSVGLLQLSHNRRAKECVKEGARSEADLKNPILNLKCGIRIMATLTAQNASLGGRRGAGAYWSVLRYSQQHRYSKFNSIASLTRREYNKAVARGPQPDKTTVTTAQVIE